MFEEARDYVQSLKSRIVIKASGLAAGKGVLLPSTTEEAIHQLKQIMVHKEFGSAGDEIVVEEFLDGEECSVLAFTDGHSLVMLPPSQDHKRAYDGDLGPNTGGMGAYAPAPIASPALLRQVHSTILQPTIDGMRKMGTAISLLFYLLFVI